MFQKILVIVKLFALISLLCLLFVTLCRPKYKVHYDVIVYSGTAAGVMAAYKAAKEGKKVLLIEPAKHLGGMTASGLGMTDIGDKEAITGNTRKFYKRIAKHYGEEDELWVGTENSKFIINNFS